MTEPRVLVTGSTGLIGEALLERVRGLGLEAHGASRTSVSDRLGHAVDLTSAQQAQALLVGVSPNTVIHLVGGVADDVGTLYALNALALANVMRASALLPLPPTVVTLGSAAEYGEPLEGVATETSPTNPISEYGRAKLAGSRLAEALSAAEGVRLTIVRPFNIVSSRLPASSALGNIREQLLGQTGSSRTVQCGRLDVVRDFIALDFVVDVLVMLLHVQSPPAVLNVCSGQGIALGQILDAMAARLGIDVTVAVLPELAAIPAPARILGDPSLLGQLGLAYESTPEGLAALLV